MHHSREKYVWSLVQQHNEHRANVHWPLRACHVLQALHICDRSSAPLEQMRSLIDWRSNLQDLSAEDATDDDLSPSFDYCEGDSLDEQLEESADAAGVDIDDEWYQHRRAFSNPTQRPMARAFGFGCTRARARGRSCRCFCSQSLCRCRNDCVCVRDSCTSCAALCSTRGAAALPRDIVHFKVWVILVWANCSVGKTKGATRQRGVE